MIGSMRGKRFLPMDSVNGMYLSTTYVNEIWGWTGLAGTGMIHVKLVPRIRANTARQDRDPKELWTRTSHLEEFVN
jgi:hypothetical protein